MLQRAPIQPLREKLKIHHINLLQMQRRLERLAKSIMRIKRRREKRRARQQDLEMERERMRVRPDGQGDGGFEKMSERVQ